MELNGRLNKCGVISPRYDVGVAELEAWTARLLPSRQVYYLLLNIIQDSNSFIVFVDNTLLF